MIRGRFKPPLICLLRLRGGFIFGEDLRIAIACNTAHMFLGQLEHNLQHKIISLIDATVLAVSTQNISRVGLLASHNTIRSGLFNTPLEQAGISVQLPSTIERDKTEKLIRAVIANKLTPNTREALEGIVQGMINEGCEIVILGCTELSVINGSKPILRTIDPLTLVAKQLV